MFSFKLHYFPVFVCVWFLGGFLITYLLAVSAGHVYAWFPYISDTAVLPPERCIFGLIMNLGAFMLAVLMYLRFLQIQLYLDAGHIKLNQIWNTRSIKYGLISCFGISVTGNFPETESLTMHLIGAGCTVTFGIIYFLIQARISYESYQLRKRLPPHGISKRLFYLRLFLISSIVILQSILPITGLLAYRDFTGTSIHMWSEKDGGMEWRLISTFSEWLLFICMFTCIATARDEFKLIEFKQVEIAFKDVPEKKEVK